MTSKSIYCAGALSVALILWVFHEAHAPQRVVADVGMETGAPRNVEQARSSSKGSLSWLDARFGQADATSANGPLQPAHIRARQKKMESLGYGAPPEYYEMDLKTLKKLAKQHDGYAMLQLAEQYYNEANLIYSDPEFPKNEDPKAVAKQYLSDAFGTGFSRAASVLAKHYFDENDPVEAYAWRLVAEKVGDSENPVWGGNTNQFTNLSPDEIARARKRFDTIWQTSMDTHESLRAY
jgi:hypothetical protein